MNTETDDFEFDTENIDLDEKTLNEMDQQFLQKIQEKTVDQASDAEADNFTFWVLVIVLVVFMFFLVLTVVLVVKARRRRNAFRLVGYM